MINNECLLHRTTTRRLLTYESNEEQIPLNERWIMLRALSRSEHRPPFCYMNFESCFILNTSTNREIKRRRGLRNEQQRFEVEQMENDLPMWSRLEITSAYDGGNHWLRMVRTNDS